MSWESVHNICWHCANAYAHKCKKFHTNKPLEIWQDYKKIMKDGVVESYIVYKCLNYLYDHRE